MICIAERQKLGKPAGDVTYWHWEVIPPQRHGNHAICGHDVLCVDDFQSLTRMINEQQ